jgi:predicted RNA methylase
MIDNKNYYPTPNSLISKMWGKVDLRKVSRILEPSAGEGHIVEFISKKQRGHRGTYDVFCIEIDPRLQAILRDKKTECRASLCSVIDSDFLAYSGVDQFDLIIANPPFDDGASHLLKAIDVMFSGQIVFLLNAETIRNPFSNERKLLVRRLNELGASIEYIKDAFLDAERKTAVEIALVYINIERNIEDVLRKDMIEAKRLDDAEIEEESGIISGNVIDGKVELFNRSVQAGMEVIKSFYTHRDNLGGLLCLISKGEDSRFVSDYENINDAVSERINMFVSERRKQAWMDIITVEEMRSRMTDKTIKEFYSALDIYAQMDFTASNIRQFMINVIGSYEGTMVAAVAEIFDRMSAKHHWSDEKSENVHYFDGWKTNKAWFVNERVVLPVPALFYGRTFLDYAGSWRLDSDAKRWIDDIDKVMNYFDASSEFMYISKAIEDAFASGYKSGQKIKSTYFEIRVFIKGTIHLKFISEDIRRRFNVTACKHKKWLFDDYGAKKYNDMTADEKNVVDEFEGSAKYKVNAGQQIGFSEKINVGLIV